MQQTRRCLLELRDLVFLALSVSAAGQLLEEGPVPGTASVGSAFRQIIQNSTNERVKVCVANFAPLVLCDAGRPPTSYTGHDVEMFRQLGSALGGQEGSDYEFQCMPLSEIVDSLQSTDGRCADCSKCPVTNCTPGCDVAATGLTITLARAEQGIIFSYPYYKSALAVLVTGYVSSTAGWSWKDPFTLSLWVAVILTLLAFPLVVFLLEFCTLKRRVHRRDIPIGVNEAAWRSTWSFMHGETLDVSSMAARIAVGAFAFMSLIVSSTYTANLAAFLTVKNINSAITSLSQLRSRAVGSSDIYLARLRARHGIVATDLGLNSDADVFEAAAELESGTYAALVFDEPILQYVASNYSNCRLQTLPERIEPFDMGLGFRKGTPDAAVDAFSTAIIGLQEDGTLSQLASSFVTAGQCALVSEVDNNPQSISFRELYGLWVILCAAVVLGAVLCLLTRMLKRKKWRAADLEAAALQQRQQQQQQHLEVQEWSDSPIGAKAPGPYPGAGTGPPSYPGPYPEQRHPDGLSGSPRPGQPGALGYTTARAQGRVNGVGGLMHAAVAAHETRNLSGDAATSDVFPAPSKPLAMPLHREAELSSMAGAGGSGGMGGQAGRSSGEWQDTLALAGGTGHVDVETSQQSHPQRRHHPWRVVAAYSDDDALSSMSSEQHTTAREGLGDPLSQPAGRASGGQTRPEVGLGSVCRDAGRLGTFPVTGTAVAPAVLLGRQGAAIGAPHAAGPGSGVPPVPSAGAGGPGSSHGQVSAPHSSMTSPSGAAATAVVPAPAEGPGSTSSSAPSSPPPGSSKRTPSAAAAGMAEATAAHTFEVRPSSRGGEAASEGRAPPAKLRFKALSTLLTSALSLGAQEGVGSGSTAGRGRSSSPVPGAGVLVVPETLDAESSLQQVHSIFHGMSRHLDKGKLRFEEA